MKISWKTWLAALACCTQLLMAGPRDNDWKRVRDAVEKGLPQTAITNLQPILTAALRDKAWAEATRALAQRIALEGQIQGGKPEEAIVRLEGELGRSPREMQPVLELVLANWYWSYFQQNRWRFLNRTATAAAPGKDFTTWDLPRLFAEIDRHYTTALQAAPYLKTVPIAAWDDLIPKATAPDSLRPTLYDFLVHQALEFYASGEQAGARPEDAVELTADEPYSGVIPLFGKADEFGAGKVERRANESSAEKALFLWRELLVFHRADKDTAAYADADLGRIHWARNAAVGETKAEKYRQALETFIGQWGNTEVGARARADLAEAFQEAGDPTGAHRVASALPATLRDTIGGRRCRNLVIGIETPTLSLQTERSWPVKTTAPSGIEVTYRNLTQVHFRAVKWDWETFLKKEWPRPDNLRPEQWRLVLAKAPAKSWSAALPATPDYKPRTASLPSPRDLPPGFYFIIASARADFGDVNDNQVSAAAVWVSDLVIVIRSQDQGLEGFVLNADSGEPLAGAEVSAWFLDRNSQRQSVPGVQSDALGFFRFPELRPSGYIVRARHGGHEVAAEDGLFVGGRERTRDAFEQTFLFSDRALYRPGQTIQYKGLCLRADQSKNDYRVLGQRDVTILLRDANGREVARARHRANDYGSFAGSFTAPTGGLLGSMSILVEGQPRGQTEIRVEEYKRPKFAVTLEAPKSAPKLQESVVVTGRATAYTGAAIDHAKVQYRVVRRVRWPWWCWWRMGNEAEQEITHGTAETGVDGTFQVRFNARPDLASPAADQPVFHFSVHADVTDTTGETRSGERSVPVGYTALEAMVAFDEWQTPATPASVRVTTQSLDGTPEPANGTVAIHRLRQPNRPVRARVGGGFNRWGYMGESPQAPTNDLSRIENWPLAEKLSEQRFTTGTNGEAALSFPLPAGAYKVVIATKDRFGKDVRGERVLRVVQPDAPRLAIPIPNQLAAPRWSVEPGGEFLALWGTGYESGRAFVEITRRGKPLSRFWTAAGATQQQIRQAVGEDLRGGFGLTVTFVHENRAYTESRQVVVPWSNKDLSLRWETFRSKLEPGQKEKWTLTIARKGNAPSGTNAAALLPTAAELVAALYDASLDQILPHSWPNGLHPFYADRNAPGWTFANHSLDFGQFQGKGWPRTPLAAPFDYRDLPPELGMTGGHVFLGTRGFAMRGGVAMMPAAAPAPMAMADAAMEGMPMERAQVSSASLASSAKAKMGSAPEQAAAPGGSASPSSPPALAAITPRKNLSETAFFFPQLRSDSNGVVKLEFSLPEALTEWRFLGFAHDRELRSGFLEARTVTAKEIMVQPNAPRFLREGDTVEFTVKVSNQSDRSQRGRARLNFSAAQDDRNVDPTLRNLTPEMPFDIPSKQSRTLAWRIQVPDGIGFLRFKAVAAGETASDGEEGFVPVLSRRVFLTESLALPIRNAGTKQFDFAKLAASGRSDSIKHESLTVQVVSQPAWYAVLALPYLMEFPHECSEQTFNRLYANALAQHIAKSNPKIARVFEQWRGTPALDSPLQKNQELKSVLIEETPWFRQAQNESAARRNVGVLFDENRLRDETARTLQKLQELQMDDGAWPWFPGGPADDYITLYIVTGFGRLRHLGVAIDISRAQQALNRLDGWIARTHAEILKGSRPDDNHLTSTIALYLYGRSFFLKEQPVAGPTQAAVDYFLGQARKYWVQHGSRLGQGHLALALQRFGDTKTPEAIVRSLRERSVSNEEFGRFWRDDELSWSWYRAPIETQALMIEVFDEVAHDVGAVEDLKVWLLKQKQTQDWKTTKATADAVYGMLLRGSDLLASDALVEMKLGNIDVTPGAPAGKQPSAPRPAVEAGTGFYERRFTGSEVTPAMGRITLTKRDAGVSWGSVHWQYFEDIGKVTPHAGTPLKLQKRLFKRVNTRSGPKLEALKGSVSPGDELVVRIELRSDRDLEYVHLKDQRGSGVEPVAALSGYRFQDGLGYYESPRDTASHFFIHYLPKGTYVFEYAVRVQLRGKYQSGVAEIQCMYAPEFNAHSESFLIECGK